MPTFKHLSTGKRFLSIHIPRTAGRFIGENLGRNDCQCEHGEGKDLWVRKNDVELSHYHREYYEKYLDVEDIPHFAVVRNPIDRFISCSIFLSELYGDNLEELLEDPMMFSSMLQNYPSTESVNWFRPQLDFISEKTHIWKFEDKFGDDFAQWLSDIVGVDIKIRQDMPVEKLPTDESKKVKRSAKLIDNVKSLYSKDIGKLYPELDS